MTSPPKSASAAAQEQGPPQDVEQVAEEATRSRFVVLAGRSMSAEANNALAQGIYLLGKSEALRLMRRVFGLIIMEHKGIDGRLITSMLTTG